MLIELFTFVVLPRLVSRGVRAVVTEAAGPEAGKAAGTLASLATSLLFLSPGGDVPDIDLASSAPHGADRA